MAGAQQPKKPQGKQDAPYNFAAAFEKAATFLACTSPKFMARAAHELRPELLNLKECRLALEGAQAIYREKGTGPAMPATVIQWAAARREDGKITQEDVMAVAGLFDTYDGAPIGMQPQAAEIEPLVIETVKKRLRFEIAQQAVREHSEAEWEEVNELMRREAALGQGEAGIGTIATPAAAKQVLSAYRGLQKVPTGIEELDAALGGGQPRGTLTCFMAGPGGAKSMTMSHVAGRMGIGQLFCGVATLELPSAMVIARILANQTGVTIDEVVSGAGDAELDRRLYAYAPVPPVVQDFEPHITTPDTIFDWVDQCEQTAGRKMDALFVDYADKLTASGKPDEKGMYQEMRIVYERLRLFVFHRQMLGFTASQSKARDEKKSKVIDLEHTADSMHKARIVDQFITLNFDDETREMTFFLAKNRFGEGRKKVGPLPTTFATGQVAPVMRDPL